MRRALTNLPSIALVTALASPNALAADIFVDKNVPSSGNGSYNQPFSSLQDGIEAAQPGDTVRVREGSYEAIRTVRSGTQTKPITIAAEKRRTVLVQANGRALDAAHPYHLFRGIVFDAGFGPQQVIRASGADHLQLIDIEARRGTSNCIALGSVRHVLITSSTIHHCVNYFDPSKNADSHGITGSSVFDLTVRDTDIYLVTGDAIQLSPSRQAWDAIRVEGSTLWSGILDVTVNGWVKGQPIGENAIDTKVGADILNGQGARPKLTVIDTVAYGWRNVITNQGAYNIKESVDAVFDRVTIYDSELAFRLRHPALVRIQNAVIYDVDYAFRLEDGLRNAAILNSTLGAKIKLAPIRFAGGKAVNLTIKNLLVLGTTLPGPAQNDASNIAIDGSGFLNPGAHDYRLVPGAPAIDAGEPIDLIPWDRIGTPRPIGKYPDVGAYERPTSSN